MPHEESSSSARSEAGSVHGSTATIDWPETSMSLGITPATTASVPQTLITGLTVDQKIDGVSKNTAKAFQRVSAQREETDDEIFELREVVINLQTRVDVLEDMVSTLMKTHPGFSSSR